MDIIRATAEYENWISQYLDLDPNAVKMKHRAMASDEFSFMRATYYRWAQCFPEVCKGETDAPKVLAVGDLHVENFGTWRDAEGRLVWGINDFDETAKLAYTIDLVRIALSLKLALKVSSEPERVWQAGTDAILDGYRETFERADSDGLTHVHPIVLAEDHRWLREIALSQATNPKTFWNKLEAETHDGLDLRLSKPELQRNTYAIDLLKRALPAGTRKAALKKRYAGLGSLGRTRIVALAGCCGSRLAREVKALAPPASKFARLSKSNSINYAKILKNAVRSPDPHVYIDSCWIVRRLSPDCSRIEFETLPDKTELELFQAMGRETANAHLADPDQIKEILGDLKSRPKSWLDDAASAMESALNHDYKTWKNHKEFAITRNASETG